MGIISQVRQEAQKILDTLDAIYASGRLTVDGRYIEMEYAELDSLFANMPGYKQRSGEWYNSTFFAAVEQTEEYQWHRKDDTKTNTEYWIEYLKQNRLRYITWLAYTNAYRRQMEEVGQNYLMSSIGQFTIKLTNTITGNQVSENGHKDEYMYKAVKVFIDAKVTKNDLVQALSIYKNEIREMEMRLERIFKSQNVTSGLQGLFEGKPTLEIDEKNAIRKQVEELQKKLENGLASRTWGFEIEVPDAKGVETQPGIEKGDDGSLRSDNHSECDCDCGDCTYHECDCDYCDNGNSDPEHCGDSYCSGDIDSAEFRTTGGIQRVKHAGMYKLLEDLNNADAEMNDSAGTHIHVFAADLTTHQVGQVMAIYKWLENIVSVVAGRKNVNYAKDIPVAYIGSALKKNEPKLTAEKPLAVNVTWLANNSDRGTIEFRQMDCNLDADKITFWAWMVRGFVETAKRGAKLGDFKEVRDLNGIVKVFERFKFTLKSENPGMIIPGTRLDANQVKRTTFANSR